MMTFEWDENKRERNIRIHRIDFIDAQTLFDGRDTLTHYSPRENEKRWATIGRFEDKVITVIWTRRGENIRIISARRARDNEQRAYREIYG
jgi:uncharacterized protein